MGTGKSSVGELLAKQLSWTYTDLDAYIVQDQQMTISEIFLQKNEAFFREIESTCLAKAVTQQNQVLATGGGAVLSASNRQLMVQAGLVIALTAPIQVIIERLQYDHTRPLLQGNVDQRVQQLMTQREHAYDFAHMTIDTSQLHTVQVMRKILSELREI